MLCERDRVLAARTEQHAQAHDAVGAVEADDEEEDQRDRELRPAGHGQRIRQREEETDAQAGREVGEAHDVSHNVTPPCEGQRDGGQGHRRCNDVTPARKTHKQRRHLSRRAEREDPRGSKVAKQMHGCQSAQPDGVDG